MAYQPSASDIAVSDALAAATYRMTMAVVSSGGVGQAYSEIKSFQILWNASKATINRFASGYGTPAWFSLVEDGLYGKNTGKALSMVTGTTTPAKTAGIPQWYLTNKALIDSYGGLLNPSVPVDNSTAVGGAQSQLNPAEIKDAANAIAENANNGSIASQNIPAQAAYVQNTGTLVSQAGTAPQTPPPAQLPTEVVVVKEVSFGDEPIIAARPATNYKVWAVGAGLAAAAGMLVYMGTRKRRAYA